MSEEEKTYRPKSPDLSAFVPPPQLARIPSYHPPADAGSGFPPGFALTPRGSYDASPYFSPQNSQPSNYFGSQPHSQPQFGFSPKLSRTPSLPTILAQQYSQHSTPYSQPRPPPPTFSTPSYDSKISPQGPYCESPIASQRSEMARTRTKRTAEEADTDYDPTNNILSRTPLVPTMSNISVPTVTSSITEQALMIDVKTKFPVARIKRIMQADEDVGKVAQATPTAVAKALELFMITLILKGAEASKAQNSKRVTAQHLKSALMADKEFDFLADVCSDIPDEDKGGAKKGSKTKSEADDSDEEMAGAPAKKRKASKRKGSDESE